MEIERDKAWKGSKTGRGCEERTINLTSGLNDTHRDTARGKRELETQKFFFQKERGKNKTRELHKYTQRLNNFI